jgi:hypothetical protein
VGGLVAAGDGAFAGGAAGLGAAGFAPAGVAAGFIAAEALAGAGVLAGGETGVACGEEVAPSGVPHRAQNLNVAAFSVMQFGHCLGGAPAASRGPLAGGVTDGFCIIVGAPSPSMGAPHDRQEPTSVSLFAPQRGHSILRLYDAFRRRVKTGVPATFRGW